MIKLGVCQSPEHIETAAAIGYDFIEGNLSQLAALSDEDFTTVCQQVHRAPIAMEAANVLLPQALKVTGPAAEYGPLRDYLKHAMERAGEIGVRVISFGSGGARNVPDGFPMAEAWRQLRQFLQMAGDFADPYGITIAIEPLRRAECNILHHVSEAVMMASLLGHRRVAALGDVYHMRANGDPLGELSAAGAVLRHVHICHTAAGDDSVRAYPAPGDGEDYAPIFAILRGMDYTGRVSIEANIMDPFADMKAAFPILDAARRG